MMRAEMAELHAESVRLRVDAAWAVSACSGLAMTPRAGKSGPADSSDSVADESYAMDWSGAGAPTVRRPPKMLLSRRGTPPPRSASHRERERLVRMKFEPPWSRALRRQQRLRRRYRYLRGLMRTPRRAGRTLLIQQIASQPMRSWLVAPLVHRDLHLEAWAAELSTERLD